MNTEFTIDGMEPGTVITIYTLMGQNIYSSISTKSKETIDVSKYAADNYIIQLTDKNGNRITKKIVKE